MSRTDLIIGTDRADISPAGPVFLAGYAARSGLPPAEDVLAPLRVRTLVLRTGDGAPLVLVGADLLWWGDDLVDEIRAAFTERFRLPEESLVLHATHTHSGPQASRLMMPSLGPADEDYLAALVVRTLDSIERALDRERPVRVEVGRTRTDAMVDRRSARTAGALDPSWIDREVTVVRFADRGETVATLVHLACHPVLHHGNAITSDLAGAVTDQLERSTTPFALYLQGCCGDVNPARYSDDGRFADGDQADVDRFAAPVTAAAERAIAAAEPAGDAGLAIERREFALPLEARRTDTELHDLNDGDDVRGEWARLMLAAPERFRRDPVLRLVRIDLSTGLRLLGMSGEPVSRYGRHVKTVSDGSCLPLGYTDGMTTYLVTAAQLAEGGYEPDVAPFYFGCPARLSPSIEPVLIEELGALAGATP